MFNVLHITPALGISLLQPNKCSANVRRTVLGVVNDHRLLRTSWHEDFDGIVVIAVGAPVVTGLSYVARQLGVN